MKKTIFSLLVILVTTVCSAYDPPAFPTTIPRVAADDYTQVALDHLHLGPAFAVYNQRAAGRTDYILYESVREDWTKKDPVTKKAPLVTSTFKIDTIKKADYTCYGLNWFAIKINQLNIPVSINGDTITITKDFSYGTVSLGAFAGQTYWYGEWKQKAFPVQGGYDVEGTGNFFMNTQSAATTSDRSKRGLPEPTNGQNPFYQISVRKTVVSSSGSNVRKPTSRLITKSELLKAYNVDYETLKYMTRSVVHFRNSDKTTNASKYVLNHTMQIERTGSALSAHVYINGRRTDTFAYRNLETVYGKKHPGYVVRWRLQNGPAYPKDAIYGASWVREYRQGVSNSTPIEQQNTTINIVKGSTVNWNAATSTLTVDTGAEQCMMWAMFEELPAQGKNDGWEYYLDFKTDKECRLPVCNDWF